MKSKKQLYENIMASVAKEVKKALNEGAGAGYTVIIDGLNATNIQLGEKTMKGNDEIIKFTADIVPGVVEKWSAESYYDYISSDGLEYDGQILQEYDDEDKQVNGGSIEGYIYIDDIYDANEEDAINYIQDHLSDFMIEVQYGSGWVHIDLTNPMEFEDCEAKVRDHYYGSETVYFDKIQIDAENIVDDINWFFEHTGEFEEIFGLKDPNFDDDDRYNLG